MTENQQHLIDLLRQQNELEQRLQKTQETYYKVLGAIEYLTQTGVTLPEQEPLVQESEES
jgi:hypothetical protein